MGNCCNLSRLTLNRSTLLESLLIVRSCHALRRNLSSMSKFFRGRFACLLLVSCFFYGIAQAQQAPQASLPDSPGAIIATNTHRASADDETSSSNDAAADPTSLQQGNPPSSPSGQTETDQPPKQTKRI